MGAWRDQKGSHPRRCPNCGSGPCGSLLASERPAKPAGRIPETWVLRCPVLRIGDAVQWWCLPGPLKPSMAAVSLAIPGQTAPSRPHHCPAHLAAAPPRVITPLDPPGRASLEISKKRRDRVGFLERRAFWRERSLESCRQAPLAFRGLGPLLPDPLPLNEKTRHFGGLFGGAWRGEISSLRRAPRTAWRPWRRRRPRR